MSSGLRWTDEFYRAWREREAKHAKTSITGGSELPAHPLVPPKAVRIATDPPTKYRNTKTGGYASKKEARRAAQLKLLEASGTIQNLREQVPYLLIPKQDGERSGSYVADFVYQEPDGDGWREVVEDCKGVRTPLYIWKRKSMLFVHGIRIRET